MEFTFSSAPMWCCSVPTSFTSNFMRSPGKSVSLTISSIMLTQQKTDSLFMQGSPMHKKSGTVKIKLTLIPAPLSG